MGLGRVRKTYEVSVISLGSRLLAVPNVSRGVYAILHTCRRYFVWTIRVYVRVYTAIQVCISACHLFTNIPECGQRQVQCLDPRSSLPLSLTFIKFFDQTTGSGNQGCWRLDGILARGVCTLCSAGRQLKLFYGPRVFKLSTIDCGRLGKHFPSISLHFTVFHQPNTGALFDSEFFSGNIIIRASHATTFKAKRLHYITVCMAPISGAIICFVACRKGCQKQQTDKAAAHIAFLPLLHNFLPLCFAPGKYYDDLHNFSAPTAAAKKGQKKRGLNHESCSASLCA